MHRHNSTRAGDRPLSRAGGAAPADGMYRQADASPRSTGARAVRGWPPATRSPWSASRRLLEIVEDLGILRPGALRRDRLELPAGGRVVAARRAVPGAHGRLGRGAGLGSRRRRGSGRRGGPPRDALADDPHEGARRPSVLRQPAVALLLLQARAVRRRGGDREGRGLRLGRRRDERLGHATARSARHVGRRRAGRSLAARGSRYHQGPASAAGPIGRRRRLGPPGVGLPG